MRNILFYYLVILLPLPFLIWLAWTGQSIGFTLLLLIYALTYRMAVDGLRLVNKRLMKRKEVWKLLIPGKRWDYSRELYFKK